MNELPEIESREIRGTTWRYATVGEGPGHLLSLPGMVGGAEIPARLAPFLGGYRILSLAYPQVESLDALFLGVEEILDAEGFTCPDVFGGSFGGLMAQGFVRHVPGRCRRLILQGTGVPTARRAVSNERFLRIFFPFVPMPVWRGLLRLVIRAVLRRMPGAERRFWLAYYGREIGALERRDLYCRYRLSIEFDRLSFTPEDLAGSSIETMILEGSADKIADEEQREALKALYPGVLVHTFEGAGHGAALLCPGEWGGAIANFLE